MKLKLEKSVLIKLLVITAILFIAPFALPFTIEFVLMVDILGLEALLLFLLLQSKNVLHAIRARFSIWMDQAAATLALLAGLYLFQPRVLISHTAGSSLILLLACSLTIALALWLPAIYFSSGGLI